MTVTAGASAVIAPVTPTTPTDMEEPTKAYAVSFRVVNRLEAIIYAYNKKDARKRFEDGEGDFQNTFEDSHLPGCQVLRAKEEDRA